MVAGKGCRRPLEGKNKADVLTISVPGVQLRKTMEDLQDAFLSKRSKGQLDVLE